MGKPLPQNNEIEKYIIGCILLDNDFQKFIPKLNESDFENKQYRKIYGNIQQCYMKNKSIDVANICQNDSSILEVVVGTMTIIPTFGAWHEHFQTLKLMSYKRKLARAALRIYENILDIDESEPMKIYAEVLRQINIKPEEFQESHFDINTIANETMQAIEARQNNKDSDRLYYGFTELDKNTAGLHKKELTIIAARPSIGKTSLMLQVALNLAKYNHACIFSLEMSREQLTERILSNLSGIVSGKVRYAKTLTNDDWKNLDRASRQIYEDLNIYINDQISTVAQVAAYCRELKTQDSLDVVFVDYLQLLKASKNTGNRVSEVTEISRDLKLLSMELNIPVVALSQLNRDSAKDNRAPKLHDLRDSGAIEQDADLVMFLHNPEKIIAGNSLQEIELIIAKQRNGATGKLSLGFEPKTYKFFNL